MPAANAPVSDEEDARVKADYRTRRKQARNSPSGLGFVPNGVSALDATPEEREATYEAAWNRLGFGFALAYKDILLDQASNDTAADFVRAKIAAAVDDPDLREKLTPRGFPFGTRRPSVDSGYFQAFNRDNVDLVDIRETPIAEFTPTGIRTTDADYPLDIIIYATGFDAFTGSLLTPRSSGAAASRCNRNGRPGRSPISASARTVSRTCSSSSGRAARRCSATCCCRPRNRSTGSPR